MKKIIGLLLLATITFSSCSKKGCVDVSAENYCDECKKDDGTCTYKGEVVFWYNKATSDSLTADAATALTYYVDGQIVGSSATSVYWISAPTCGQGGSITVSKDLGTVKNKTYTYSIKDQTGFEYWNGTINFTGGNCLTQQLAW